MLWHAHVKTLLTRLSAFPLQADSAPIWLKPIWTGLAQDVTGFETDQWASAIGPISSCYRCESVFLASRKGAQHLNFLKKRGHQVVTFQIAACLNRLPPSKLARELQRQFVGAVSRMGDARQQEWVAQNKPIVFLLWETWRHVGTTCVHRHT